MTNTLNTAFLSNNGEYTFFKFRDRVITFLPENDWKNILKY